MGFKRPKSPVWKRLFAATKPLQRLAIWACGSQVRAASEALFGTGFYQKSEPEVAGSGLLPAMDYYLFGAAEGRDPHPLFSTTYYLESYPDIREKRTNPLLHYIRFGAAELRDPHLMFSTSYYVERHPESQQDAVNPLVHYLRFGSVKGHDPHPIFSTSYYLETYPDIERAGVNPLIHYLRFGRAERRDPHPLFSTSYYLEKYPDVLAEGSNPLLHYLRFGQSERRKPHSLFDTDFYYATQPDVLDAKVGALAHYVWKGSREGRAPSCEFDPFYYTLVHVDVARNGVEPLSHYARWGCKEKRSVRGSRFESGHAENYLPARSSNFGKSVENNVSVDIIVPIYRGFEETRACLESVFTSNGKLARNVVVINDCTPEIALRDYLRELANDGQVHLIEHPTNRGFVGSVNEGMSLHPERDVVLLNSDTRVFEDWLDRLASHAYDGHVGSVTPFSNNATICSYPKFCENNALPDQTGAEELDRVMRSVNAGRHSAIPTGVGFCMYIRRDCLQETGLFDEEAFGRGYGEENDFCMRALEGGWKHLLAADVFVYHAGSVSFGPATEAQRRAMEVLLRKHPRYLDRIGWHFEANPANAFRIAATTERLRQGNLPVWMSVVHGLGGGTREHVRQLEKLTQERLMWVHLAPASDFHIRLSCERAGFEFSVTLRIPQEYDLLVRLLREMRVERIHVHHLLALPIDIQRLAADLHAPYEITLHDYYFVCPKINMTDEAGRYCAEPENEHCESCVSAAIQSGRRLDILSWRAVHGALLGGAARVIAPSADSAKRFQNYFPWLNITPAWHENVTAPVSFRQLQMDEPLRVAVLGVMSLHKGYVNLQACSEAAQKSLAPVAFRLLGPLEKELDASDHSFAITGPYKPEELTSLLSEYKPHIVWFPCQWPETFSYTLSTCLSLGLPVAAPDLGAFAERLGGREWSWVLPWDTTPGGWLNFFLQIREQHFRTGLAPPIPQAVARAETDYYPDRFLNTEQIAKALPRTSGQRKSVLAVASSFENGQIQACGYIRIIQPLTHPSISSLAGLDIADAESVLRRSADVIIVQRTAITDLERAEELVDHCRKRGIQLVYETDDDLFRLSAEHPEALSYSRHQSAAKLIARAADAVTVSTEPLRQAMLRYNQHVVVIPNWIDERLWETAKRAAIQPHQSAAGIRGIYMGTLSHRPDLAILEKPVRRIKETFDFELDIIGVTSDQGSSPWFQCVAVPDNIGCSYPRFVAWLQSAGRWDFGLAPLLDSRFNMSKSPIKVYEYGYIELPTIASDVSAYRDAIQDGETGLLPQNTEEDWYENLRLLCESPTLRTRFRDATISTRARWTLKSNGHQARSAWKSVLFCTEVEQRAS